VEWCTPELCRADQHGAGAIQLAENLNNNKPYSKPSGYLSVNFQNLDTLTLWSALMTILDSTSTGFASSVSTAEIVLTVQNQQSGVKVYKAFITLHPALQPDHSFWLSRVLTINSYTATVCEALPMWFSNQHWSRQTWKPFFKLLTTRLHATEGALLIIRLKLITLGHYLHVRLGWQVVNAESVRLFINIAEVKQFRI